MGRYRWPWRWARPRPRRRCASCPGRAKAPAAWSEIDRLQDQQQLEQASRRIEARLTQARARGDGEDQTRALIRWTQLRVALHGYETAVRWLREQRWPDELLGQTALNLYYAGALRSYAQSYAWEIGQRERVDTRGRVDLKAWTMEQLYAEAHRACAVAFGQREALGRVPTAQLAELITPNTYPVGVRPTLRDALTYLWVELLADTQGWRPEQQHALFQLDLGALLGTPPLAAGALADPAVHPLLRVAALLDELERWHHQRHEAAASLEARLERLRRLHAAFTEPSDRARLRQDLTQRLVALRGNAWWAMGMAELAELTREEDAPDSLLRARRLAEEGQRADPQGPGGRRCLAIAKAITAPAFELAAMSHDLPGRRSIGVQHRNLAALHFRAYALELRQQLAASRDYSLFPEGAALRALLEQRPTLSWTAKLPATPDHRSHWTHLTPPLTRRGYYVVTASARADYAPANNVILATNVILSGLALVSQQDRDGLELTAVSGDDSRPLPGVRVSLFRRDWQAGHRVALERRTDAQGRVRLPLSEGASYFVLAQHGDDLALDPSSVSGWSRTRQREASAALIFTDRSIYRPQQQLQWKVVAYRGRAELGRLSVAPKSRVTVTLSDANGEQVEQRQVTTNAYGTAAGAFTLPASKLLGTWTLTSSPAGAAQIRVEAYKRPTFEVALDAPARALRLNQPATLAGRARYYFGLPVTQGAVRWRVRRVPVYPWWWGFGWRAVAPAPEQVIATGTSTLDAAGRFALRFVPRADERLREQRALSYRYSVTAEVTNEGGETGTAERAFRLGFVALEAALRDEPGFLRAGQPAALTIARHDLDGTAAPGPGRYRLLALQQPKQTLAPAEWPMDPTTRGRSPGRLRHRRGPAAAALGARLRARGGATGPRRWAGAGAWRAAARRSGRGPAGATGPRGGGLPAALRDDGRLRWAFRAGARAGRGIGRHAAGAAGAALGRAGQRAGRRTRARAGALGSSGPDAGARPLPRGQAP
ncbi:MAG: hypothetical protein IPG96_01080 [Proteobacteria bacterium]|nr:hypothetical protein [Pseudomonadota bacterium]